MQLYEYNYRCDGSKEPAIIMYETCLQFGLLQRFTASIISDIYVSKADCVNMIRDVIWETENNT
jgi:hypothetical protein